MSKPKKFYSETRWIITFHWGCRDEKRVAYCGASLSKKDAIKYHCRMLYGDFPNDRFDTLEECWDHCKENGSRAVKAKIGWVE